MMTPPFQTISRSPRSTTTSATAPALVTPSVCTPPDNHVLGQCFDQNGPVPGRFNCAACCALRGAVAWLNPNTGAVVAC